MTIYVPYTYRIAWSSIDKHYYGVRYAKNCHPNDFWNDYFTSSDLVEEYRQIYGEPDIIEIRKTFSDAESAQRWEVQVLKRLNVLHNEKWLNRSIAGVFIFTDDIRQKLSNSHKGKKLSDSHRKKLSELYKGKPSFMLGKKHSEETRRKMSQDRKGEKSPSYGKKFSDEHRRKMSLAKKGRKLTDEHRRKIAESCKRKLIN